MLISWRWKFKFAQKRNSFHNFPRFQKFDLFSSNSHLSSRSHTLHCSPSLVNVIFRFFTTTKKASRIVLRWCYHSMSVFESISMSFHTFNSVETDLFSSRIFRTLLSSWISALYLVVQNISSKDIRKDSHWMPLPVSRLKNIKNISIFFSFWPSSSVQIGSNALSYKYFSKKNLTSGFKSLLRKVKSDNLSK